MVVPLDGRVLAAVVGGLLVITDLTTGKTQRRRILGGMINEYERAHPPPRPPDPAPQ